MPSVIAESVFERFIEECFNELAQELSPVMGPKDVAKELIDYMSHYSGQRVGVRMQGGHVQPHQAFKTGELPNSGPVIQLPQPGDELLTLFSLEDFRVLDGLVRDLQEKADDLGLPWDCAFDILKGCLNDAEGKATERKTAEATVAEKIEHPEKYPLLRGDEVMAFFNVKRSTVYRWVEEGKLQRAELGKSVGRRSKFLVLTKSAAALTQESSE